MLLIRLNYIRTINKKILLIPLQIQNDTDSDFYLLFTRLSLLLQE